MTQQPNILEFAKQGNPQAIAALLNRNLQQRGITAKVAAKQGGVLHILLEAPQAPDVNQMVDFIQQGMGKLQPAGVRSLLIFGREIGAEMPDWSQEVSLASPVQASQAIVPEPTIQQPAAPVKPAKPVVKATPLEQAAKWVAIVLVAWAFLLIFSNWLKALIVLGLAGMVATQCRGVKDAIATHRRNPALRGQLQYLEDFNDMNPVGKAVVAGIVAIALLFSFFLADLLQNTVGFPSPLFTASSSSSYSSSSKAPAPPSVPETSARTSERTPEENLAIIDGSSDVSAYAAYLDRLESKCKEDRAMIADMAYTSTKLIKTTKTTNLRMLKALEESTSTTPGTVKCSEYLTLLVTIVNNGQ